MSLYYVLINESRKEYLDLSGYELSISNWSTIKHGLLVAYVLQYSSWSREDVRMIDDGSGTNDEYCEITSENNSDWKNKADDFIKDFNVTLEEDQKQYKIEESD